MPHCCPKVGAHGTLGLATGVAMNHVRNGYRGLSIFMGLNIDRILAVIAILGAVILAGWIQSI
ncbi:hypothetical protein JANAI62_24350 [Jannaschia pagri]|uniref:Uncharacterized protein n=1 Tax=Jannaschia pagri TaxID=2829797 RepID=A0ABQ4NN36_9RHOB|nr:hypothetical protein JANAI61_24360 [Jannaschia sp. AI_61]GIT95812.1 hypothetical protein JANAI62_24350 [Jannaschia sp. AI_62]